MVDLSIGVISFCVELEKKERQEKRGKIEPLSTQGREEENCVKKWKQKR